jgi:hypothetical protein
MVLIARVTQPSGEIRQPHGNSTKVARARNGTAVSKWVIQLTGKDGQFERRT